MVRIPTASKLKQYYLCPRSVIESGPATNQARDTADKKSAAWVGQSLHKCLEVYIGSRINLSRSRQESYLAALDVAKGIGVMSQFCQMDIATMDSVCFGLSTVQTEIPLILSNNLKVRSASYESLTDNDILAGTADFIIFTPGNSIVVGDWKTGMDDVDDPEENEQLLALGLMAKILYGSLNVRLALVNPILKTSKISDVNGIVFHASDLMNVDKTKENAGDHCRYCDLKPNCESFANMASGEIVHAGFQDPLRTSDE